MGIDFEFYLDAEGEDLADAYDSAIGDAEEYLNAYDDYDDYYEEPDDFYDDEQTQPDNAAENNFDENRFFDMILSNDAFLDRLLDRLEDRIIERLSPGLINKIKNKPDNNFSFDFSDLSTPFDLPFEDDGTLPF